MPKHGQPHRDPQVEACFATEKVKKFVKAMASVAARLTETAETPGQHDAAADLAQACEICEIYLAAVMHYCSGEHTICPECMANSREFTHGDDDLPMN